MSDILFKLTDPITRSSVGAFRTENPDVIPTKGANLTEFGFAWGEYDPKPSVGDGEVVVPGDPVLEGAFVRVSWTVRDKTEAELLAEIPWQNATEARKAVVQWINGLTAQIEELYPSAVQERWDEEEEAARAVDHDAKEPDSTKHVATQRHIDMMTKEGAKKNRTSGEHALHVIANADRFRAIADRINELFLEVDANLQAAVDPKTGEPDPLQYPAIFAWAKQQAAPLAEAYGLQT